MSSWNLRGTIRRRLDSEIGTLRKQAALRIALCYPSPYPVGMSSLGFQTIYREIHQHPDCVAERAFLPDRVDDYRKSRIPIFTYETETRIADFPIVAFSFAYELEIHGFFDVLSLGGIPLLREHRGPSDPLVVVGGPITNSNPMPLDPFADVILLGEADDLIHDFLDSALSMNRESLLRDLSKRPGCYVPGLSHSVPEIARAADHRLPARSQILAADSVLSSMFLIEPERGCSRGCTYCVLRRTTNGGMRLVAPDRISSLVPAHARRVGLVGAAVTDHPQIKDIVRLIIDSEREIGISSLRADRLDSEFVGLLARGGYRTLTTASDGASQRIRDFVDRKTSEQHLIRAAKLARQHRLHRLKLYEMLGLPGENTSDIDELTRFCLELAQIIPVALGISPFVAKRNTPLDGAPYESISSLDRKLARLRRGLQGKVQMRPTSARWGWLEYMLSQGGREAGLAAMDAYRKGGKFVSWKRAIEDRGVVPFGSRGAVDGRRVPPTLPWKTPAGRIAPLRETPSEQTRVKSEP